MTLPIGTRLGPYEISAPLGAGGMGSVYRARDTKLGRDVAIKVLPEEFAQDRDRLARFEREAHVLAALNHPNIAAIFGLEGTALVMEYVPGATLRGPLPVDEALAVARQIADALEAAHEKGVVHRDLKPGNVNLTPDGRVKVLDFGLAKAMEDPPSAEGISNSPTISQGATRAGMVLGTAAYMSPEQARGRPVDKRTDIWAFGCVLYELLAGKQAFGGETVADCTAAIMTREPDWAALPAGSPLELLRRCLQKDPRLRLRDIGDAFPYGRPLGEEHPRRIEQRGPWRRLAPWLAGGLASVLAAAVGFSYRRPPPPDLVPVRAALALPPKATLSLSRGSAVALSPDGRRVVFIATLDGRSGLYQRPVDSFESTPIRGTEGASNPFFSPDGEWVGFFAEAKLKKVALRGGEPVTLCDAQNGRGEAWAPDDTIFFTPTSGSGLFRVPAAGGKPRPVTTPQKGEFSHRWPHALPGGRAVLFTVWNDTGFEDGRIAAHVLESGERRMLLQGGSYARFAPTGNGRTGHLIYARAGGLMAVPFDPDGLRITGTPVPILEGVVTNLSGGAHFSFSRNGALVYVPGGMNEAQRSLALVRPDGSHSAVIPIRGMSLYFALSPDGRRLVRSNPLGPTRDIWIHDLERGTVERLTYGNNDSNPVWSPDGRRIAFSSGLPKANLAWKAADGSGDQERLATSSNDQFPTSFSPDGTLLAFAENDPSSGADIWVLPLHGNRTPRAVLQTPFSESMGVFSPDGKWLAYHSNESGRFEVFVQAFPAGGRKWQVSTEGGQVPRWSRDGRTIFYRNRDAMMAVAVRPAGAAGTAPLPDLVADKPRILFEGAYELIHDVAPDGRFALIPIQRDAVPPDIHLVLNWFEDLQRRFGPRN